jgi:hypothetical protein
MCVFAELAYNRGLATPPFFVTRIQGMNYYSDGIASESESCCQRQPLEEQLAGSAKIKDSILGIVDGRFFLGQRLAARAQLRFGLGIVRSVTPGSHDAANGEGGEEEDEQYDGVCEVYNGQKTLGFMLGNPMTMAVVFHVDCSRGIIEGC